MALKAVLVTGASTGIGRATALRLDAAGWRVFAGVRREADAEALGQGRIGAAGAADARRHRPGADRRRRARASARSSDGRGLDGLVNNAGVAIPGPLETLPVEDFRRQIEVNLIGQVAVTQAMLGRIRDARGRVVFISSIGGRIAFPLTGAYHAAKFGIEAVGDVFRQELRPWGIAVSIVEPGSIDTPIWERGEREADQIGERAHPGQEELYGRAIAGYRKTVSNSSPRAASLPEKVAETDRARAEREPARAPATWSASTRRSRRG